MQNLWRDRGLVKPILAAKRLDLWKVWAQRLDTLRRNLISAPLLRKQRRRPSRLSYYQEWQWHGISSRCSPQVRLCPVLLRGQQYRALCPRPNGLQSFHRLVGDRATRWVRKQCTESANDKIHSRPTRRKNAVWKRCSFGRFDKVGDTCLEDGLKWTGRRYPLPEGARRWRTRCRRTVSKIRRWLLPRRHFEKSTETVS